MTEFLEQAAVSEPLINQGFIIEGLCVFAGLVFLVWVLPGLIHRQNANKEESEAIASHSRLKIPL